MPHFPDGTLFLSPRVQIRLPALFFMFPINMSGRQAYRWKRPCDLSSVVVPVQQLNSISFTAAQQGLDSFDLDAGDHHIDYLIEESGCFSRHAGEVGHPG
jgi:hypothetical protein